MSTSESTPTVAVTGAAGYIGSRLVALLRDAYPRWEVRALDNFYKGNVREIDGVTVEHVDVRQRDRLEDALAGADVVCHLAAISGVDDCDDHPDLAYEVNVQGTNNVAWFCHKTGAAMIFPFSMAVLGDPESFPITVDDARDPLNWYGRTKLISERAIRDFADGAFPAHMFMISNLYGEHVVDGQRVSKSTITNFFVNRAVSGEPLTVYEPGTQSRNYIHVDDVARAYVHSIERLLEARAAGETGVTEYEIATDEDLSAMRIAELVEDIGEDVLGRDVEVQLIENPRDNETLVEQFTVDTSRAANELGWEPERSVEESIRHLLEAKADGE